MTYADVNFGVELMTTCILVVPFSVVFHYSYSVSPYDLKKPRMLPLSEIPPRYSSSADDGNESQQAINGPSQQQQQRHISYETGGQYYGGPLGIKAWLTVLDPREILRAIYFTFTMRNTARTMNRDVIGVSPPTYQEY